jgi:hypothetical protein
VYVRERAEPNGMSETIFRESDAADTHRQLFGMAREGVILVAPGVNQPHQSAYAIDAVDFSKVLAEHGAEVEWASSPAEREYIDLKSVEVFLGTFVVTVVSTAIGNLLADAISRYLGDRAVRRLNVRIVESETARSFEADGDAAEVVKALRAWRK